MQRKVEAIYNNIAKDYQKMLTDSTYFNKITSKFCSKVKGKILDAGCGNGFITNLLFQKNSNVIGIDISNGMIKEAKSHYPKIKFIKMNMSSLKFKDNSFDGIFCFQAFQHIQPNNQEKVLRAFFRILNKNGILMFNTNNRFYYRRFVSIIINKLRFPQAKFGEVEIGGKTHSYRYLSTFPELKNKLNRCGFKITYYEAPYFSKWIQIWAVK